MSTWNHGSAHKCKEVSDIIAILNQHGAKIRALPRPLTTDMTLDQGEAVLSNNALWNAMPPHMDGWAKEELHAKLTRLLNESR